MERQWGKTETETKDYPWTRASLRIKQKKSQIKYTGGVEEEWGARMKGIGSGLKEFRVNFSIRQRKKMRKNDYDQRRTKKTMYNDWFYECWIWFAIIFFWLQWQCLFFLLWRFFSVFLPLYGWGVNTLRISIMISLGSREEVVFMLHVKRRDRGFTWSSFTLL